MNSENHWLESVESDLRYYADYLRGLSRELLDTGLSKYPVFVAYHEPMPTSLGRPILIHQHLDTHWSVNLTVMEDFVAREIVTRSAFPEFRKSWKDPEFFMCVFVYTPSKCAFLYMPYDLPTGEGDDESE
jgi:hypothetical protein